MAEKLPGNTARKDEFYLKKRDEKRMSMFRIKKITHTLKKSVRNIMYVCFYELGRIKSILIHDLCAINPNS